MCFAIPRDQITYVGTTDTAYNENINDPTIKEQDINYLINAINNNFKIDKITKKDIISCWAGLRPLIFKEGVNTKELSRKDEISISKFWSLKFSHFPLTSLTIYELSFFFITEIKSVGDL